MTVCLFLTFRAGAPVDAPEIWKVEQALASAPKLRKALIHTSSSADDPYIKDEKPPQLVLQLYFAELPDLEAALGRHGPLTALTSHAEFPVIGQADVTQQAMTVRTFAVPEPKSPGCTYLVAYEGEAQDLNAWLDHYVQVHTGHMAGFPGIRELEIYTRLDWIGALPFRRVSFMQRNKVAFDDAAALTAALHSPVRHAMRADFQAFPPFTGPVTHFAMATRVVHPAA